MRGRFFVNVSHLSVEQMQMHGFTRIDEDEDHILYQTYSGDHHIVKKAKPAVYVEDVNDALAMGVSSIVSW